MDRLDRTGLDLDGEFRANPFGEHSPDLQYLLNLMRTPTDRPFHVLFVDQAGERWTLGLKEPGSRTAPRRTNTVFTNLKQAEWTAGGAEIVLALAPTVIGYQEPTWRRPL